MLPISSKQYIVVGDHLTGEDGLPYFVEPLELCRLYKVDPSVAILVDRRHHTYRILIRKYPDLPVLMPKQDGQYNIK